MWALWADRGDPNSRETKSRSLTINGRLRQEVSRESDTGALDSVIQTESEVHTGRVNIGMANGPTDSSVISPSSDSVVHSLGERTTQTKSVSESVAGIPDPRDSDGK